jgi:hypothetical protein
LIEIFKRIICLGSAASVAAAQRTIGAALNDLEKSIEKAEGLKTTAINEFAGQTEALLKIMGPEAAKYTEQKADIEDRLRLEYEKEQKLHAEIAHKKGKMPFILDTKKRISPYICATSR